MTGETFRDVLPTPSASPLTAHLARFRYTSPSSSLTSSPRRSPRRAAPSAKAALAASQALQEAIDSPATTPKRRKEHESTPPRSDGTSKHFRTAAAPIGDAEKDEEDYKEDDEGEGKPSPKKKRKRPARPYADPSLYAHLGEDPLTDYMIEDGKLMLCGINPGRLSAEKGLHYANPTNHYWRCLAGSGLTDRLLLPSEGHLLSTQYSISATNLVPRPTAEMSEISNDEMKACVPSLLRKIIKYRPRMVAFVGMKICEIVLRYLHNLPLPSPPPPVAPSSSSATSLDPPLSPSKSKRKAAMPKVKIGLQPVVISLPAGVEKVDEVKKEEGESKPKQEEEEEEQRGEKQQEQRKIYIWCLPSTSARVVEYQLNDKIALFTTLRLALDRLEAGSDLELPEGTVDYSVGRFFPSSPGLLEEQEAVKGEGEKAGGGAWKVTMIKEEDVKTSREE